MTFQHRITELRQSNISRDLTAITSTWENALAPTKPPAIPVQNVHELATDFGILFDGDASPKKPARA